jgi:integrase
MAGKPGRRGFGYARKLPSGRWQASYLGPDGKRHTARTPEGKPLTFDTMLDAGGWLALRQSEIIRNAWRPPAELTQMQKAEIAFSHYAHAWLNGRDLSESTRLLYTLTLRRQVLPKLGDVSVTALSPVMIREWHAWLKSATGPTQRAHAYSLVRTILGTAAADDLIAANPCRIRGAGQAKRARQIKPATLEQLEVLVEAMPPRYRLMVLFAAWNALRFGELAELRRSDIDLKNAVVHVRRGVIRTGSGRAVKGPKSEAGKRDVNIPPHLMPLVKQHLQEHVLPKQDALLFPAAGGGHMAPSTLYAVYHPAREAAGRDDLRFHDLRHTGAVLAAATGATLAELMARLGHSTVSAAMRYQHAASDRDKAIAEALSKLATVTPIGNAKGKRKEA